jgi:acyl carrier protein
MTDLKDTILASLSDIGLGPQRIERARGGDALFGSGGLLNSIELVQFIVALSDRTGVESFEFMERFEGGGAVFQSAEALAAFIQEHTPQNVAV